jgi:hypothetical protein
MLINYLRSRIMAQKDGGEGAGSSAEYGLDGGAGQYGGAGVQSSGDFEHSDGAHSSMEYGMDGPAARGNGDERLQQEQEREQQEKQEWEQHLQQNQEQHLYEEQARHDQEQAHHEEHHDSAPTQTKTGTHPHFRRLVVCAFCGQQTSYASLAHHQKSCETKREREQQDLPKKLRKHIDLGKIQAQLPGEHDEEEVYLEYNKEAEKVHEDASPQCPECHRTFFADRLLRHMKTCCPHQL